MRRWALIAAAFVAFIGGVTLIWARGSASPAMEPGPSAPKPPAFESLAVRAPEGEEGLSLSGWVRDANGVPVAGAEVSLVSSAQQRLTNARCAEAEALLLTCHARETVLQVEALLAKGQGLLRAAETVHTDAEGRFQFEHLRGDSFSVWARGPGLGTALQDRAAPGEPLELFLPPLRSVAGRVVDESGAGVAGARVWAVSRKLSLAEESRTDGGGYFEVAGLGEGPFYVLASAAGLLPAMAPQVEAGPTPINLSLLRPRALDVTVLRDGAPAEATVRLEADHLHRTAQTKGGRVRLDRLFPDRLMVSAVSGTASSQSVTVPLSGLETPLTLHLEEGGKLWVSVVDEAGQPVPDPKVRVALSGGEVVEEHAARTGELVGFGPLGPGDYLIQGEAMGFKTARLPVQLKPGETTLELVMMQGTVIAGRVLDIYGRGAGGISVLVQPTGDIVHADADGRFQAMVPSPGEYTLHAHHSDWGGAEKRVTAPDSAVELSLEPGSSLRVVVQAQGRRLEGASAAAWIDDQTVFRSDSLSGPDGVVWMRGLPPGQYTVVGTHADHLASNPVKATLAEGQEETVEVELREGAVIEGRVETTDGAPVAGAYVAARPQMGEVARSDTEGRFTLRGLPTDRQLVLEASHPEHDLTERVRVRTSEQTGPVRLIMKARGRYRGRVVGEGGAPIARFRVEGRDFVDPEGRFEIALSQRGTRNGERVLLTVEAPGFIPDVKDFAADQPDLGTIALERAPLLDGRVVDEGGAPVASAVVSCEECEGQALSGEDGRFELVLPGFDHGVALTASKGSLSTRMELSGSARRGVEVVLRASVALTGTVHGVDGRPVGGAAVALSGANAVDSQVVVTGADGRFRHAGAPGNYRLAVSPGPGAGPPMLHVIRVPESGVDVVLGPGPGTSRLTVEAPVRRGWVMALVRGDFQPGPNLMGELLNSPWAQILGRQTGGTVRFEGLQPGRHTLIWSPMYSADESAAVVRPVDVGGDQALTLAATATP